MPINCYTGLMGSGKSFECVSSVILPAILAGRNVVTNVDGIDGDAIRAYLLEQHKEAKLDQLGTVIHCKNDDVAKADFLPHGLQVDTLVKPGDLVCIDEAWRFWGADKKLLEEHKIFFREHRHYVNSVTKVSCDLVLMVQDISDLNRILKVVVELTFKTTKIKSLGLNKVYRVEMWEGYKLTIKGRSSVQVKKYDKRIFPLYSSYDGGAGKELTVDGRQNILNSKTLWLYVFAMVVLGGLAVFAVKRFFNPKQPVSKVAEVKKSNDLPGALPANNLNNINNYSKPAVQGVVVSDVWRLAGGVKIDGKYFVVLTSPQGLRFESPTKLVAMGPASVVEIDGKQVNKISGVQRIQSQQLQTPVDNFRGQK